MGVIKENPVMTALRNVELPDKEAVIRLARLTRRWALVARLIGPAATIALVIWVLNTVGQANIPSQYAQISVAALLGLSVVLELLDRFYVNKLFLILFVVITSVALIFFARRGDFANLLESDKWIEGVMLSVGIGLAGAALPYVAALVGMIFLIISKPVRFILVAPVNKYVQRKLAMDHPVWVGLIQTNIDKGYWRLMPYKGRVQQYSQAIYAARQNADSSRNSTDNGQDLALATMLAAALGGDVITSSGADPSHAPSDMMDINPGSGLPTTGGPGTIDIAGNSYGTSDAFIGSSGSSFGGSGGSFDSY